MSCVLRALMYFLLLSGFLAPARAQDMPITGKEIQDTWVGKMVLGTTANGAEVTMRLLADGTATLSAGSTTDSGTWRSWESGYCTTWKTSRAGQERCFTARRSGSRITVLNPDGSISGYFHEIR
jgi:hypothetical protein